MSTITSHLTQHIENFRPYTELSVDERKQITFEGIESFISKKIHSRRYRGSTFPPAIEERISRVLEQAIAEHKPIHFSIPFGGFKNYRMPSFPHIDWAEIFAIVHLRNFATEIAKGYEPGVIIQFVSDEVFISRMNNISQQDLDTYNNEFNLALAYIQRFTPTNVQLRFTKIRDEISEREIHIRFDKEIEKLRKDWNKLSTEEQEKRLAKTSRNYKLSEKKYTKKELRATYFESTLVHDAFIFGDWESGVPWAFRSDMLPIGFRYTGTWGLHVTSSHTSTVQFWVGCGALLERDNNTYLPTILTFEQWQKATRKTAKTDTELATIIPSLQRIEVVNQ